MYKILSFLLNPKGSLATARRGRFLQRLSPIQVVALTFLLLIALGSLLLSLPISQRPGLDIPLLDVVFTATSATCVTGLVTVSTSDSWTRFGQIVILMLIQIGGLGYMTVATITATMLGLRVGLRVRLQLQESQGALSLHSAIRMARYAVFATLTIELIGAVILAFRFYLKHQMSLGRAVFEGIFYSVSAFCNAGFDLAPAFEGLHLPAYRADLPLLLVFTILIILGGLGFGVLAEIVTLPRMKRMTLHAKLVLCMTGVLLVLGTVLFLLFEFENPASLGGLPNLRSRLATAWFMSVTPRTAGFTPVDLGQVSPPALFLISILMIVGGAPGSTTGGIKVTTLAIIFLAILALVRRRPDIEAFSRRVSGDMSRLALSLTGVYIFAVLLVTFAIGLLEITFAGLPLTPESALRYNYLFFEVVSAFGTVGLSAGITPTLTPISRALIIFAMYLGRLGPLAFVFTFAQPKQAALRRLPEEGVMAG